MTFTINDTSRGSLEKRLRNINEMKLKEPLVYTPSILATLMNEFGLEEAPLEVLVKGKTYTMDIVLLDSERLSVSYSDSYLVAELLESGVAEGFLLSEFFQYVNIDHFFTSLVANKEDFPDIEDFEPIFPDVYPYFKKEFLPLSKWQELNFQ